MVHIAGRLCRQRNPCKPQLSAAACRLKPIWDISFGVRSFGNGPGPSISRMELSTCLRSPQRARKWTALIRRRMEPSSRNVEDSSGNSSTSKYLHIRPPLTWKIGPRSPASDALFDAFMSAYHPVCCEAHRGSRAQPPPSMATASSHTTSGLIHPTARLSVKEAALGAAYFFSIGFSKPSNSSPPSPHLPALEHSFRCSPGTAKPTCVLELPTSGFLAF